MKHSSWLCAWLCAALLWITVGASPSQAAGVSCTLGKNPSPGAAFARATICEMNRNFGFDSPWLPSSGENRAATVGLKIEPQAEPHKYRAYWLQTAHAEALLEDLMLAEAKGDGSAAQAIKRLTSALTGAHDTARGRQSLVTGIRTEVGTERRILEIETPTPSGGFYPLYSLLVIGSPEADGAEVFVTIARANITSTNFAYGLSFGLSVFLLWFLATGLFGARWRLFSGFKGHLSLSSFQIALFTCAVLYVLVNLFVRTGTLGDLSDNVLLLMGVVAAGGTGAKVSEWFSQEMSASSVSWLKARKWFDPNPPYQLQQLVQDKRGQFDIFRFQALLFSILVAAYLLFSVGQSGLQDVEIPTSILGVLGLSQVTYIGGKAIPSTTLSELNTAILKYQDMPFGNATEKAAKKDQMEKIKHAFEDNYGSLRSADASGAAPDISVS